LPCLFFCFDRVLIFLQNYTTTAGEPSFYRRIHTRFKWLNAVDQLIRQGYLRLDPKRNAGVVLVTSGKRVRQEWAQRAVQNARPEERWHAASFAPRKVR
jgi:hypothetical protein